MSLVISTWLWGDKFSSEDVAKLAAGVARNLKQPHRFICVTDEDLSGIETTCVKDPGLTKQKGCFARLRMFDDVWQREIGLQKDDRFVCIDLDTVITGELDPLFDRPEPFVIMRRANKSNPCPFNGALMMLRAGSDAHVWETFSLEKVKQVPFYEFPDDQGWIWHMLPGAAGWDVGPKHGVYVWQKRGWPGGDELPKDARLVTFVNKGPRDITHLEWVREHWRL